MLIKCSELKMGRSDLGWYIKSGRITLWCNSLVDAFEHIKIIHAI